MGWEGAVGILLVQPCSNSDCTFRHGKLQECHLPHMLHILEECFLTPV